MPVEPMWKVLEDLLRKKELEKKAEEQKEELEEVDEVAEALEEVIPEEVEEVEEVKAEVQEPDLKKLVATYYDLQNLRIAIENRVRTAGIDILRAEAKYLRELERRLSKAIEKELQKYPIYTMYLKNIKGLGAVLSAALITMFDVYKAEHPSSFWKYAGLHTVDGKAVKRKRGEKVDYNTKAKTLAWKVGRQLLMSKNEFYTKQYEKFRAYELQKLNNPIEDPTRCPMYAECAKKLKKAERPSCKMHIHLRAMRKMVKYFLAELHLRWRKVEGLPVTAPYGVAKGL